MDITCEKCSAQFKIQGHKIPEGKTASLKCPKCKTKISVIGGKGQVMENSPPPAEEPPPEEAAPAPKPEQTEEQKRVLEIQKAKDAVLEEAGFEEVDSDDYDAEDKPFDFVEEDGKTALICEADPDNLAIIQQALKGLDYHAVIAPDARDALKKMRFHVFELAIVNEDFFTNDPDRNGVLIYLERLQMTVRRKMFVALISSRFRTNDNMMAFNKSVNIIINSSNISEIGKIVKRGMTDNEMFYRVYKETMTKFGKL